MRDAPSLSSPPHPALDPALHPTLLRLLRVALIALAVFVLLGPLATGAAGQEVQIGFGSRSLVTERSNIPLGGYGGRGLLPIHGVHDACMAKAMAIQSGDELVVLVALDLIGVQRTIVEELVTREYPGGRRLTLGNLLVTATHTHAGYGGLAQRTGAWYLDTLFFVTCGPFKKGFFKELTGKLEAAIADAIEDLQPARIGIDSEEVPGLSRNRRGGAITDPELGVIKVTAPDGALRGLLVNFTAHPTLLGGENLLLSAGYPGAVQRALEDRYPGTTVLFTNGAEGDQSVSGAPGPHKDRWDKVEKTGARMADHVDRIQKAIETRATLAISSRVEEKTFPKSKGTLEERIKQSGGQKRSLFSNAVLGDVLLMGIPGEPCAQIGLDLKAGAKARGFRKAFILGLCQDHCGYFVHEDDYGPGREASHEYEKGLNFYGPSVGAFFSRVQLEDFAPDPLPGK